MCGWWRWCGSDWNPRIRDPEPRSLHTCQLHPFTFRWPEMGVVHHFFPQVPSFHLPLVASHLHVHFSQLLPQDAVLFLALLSLQVHLGAQHCVAIVHQFADLSNRRVGEKLNNGSDLRLEAHTVRHHQQHHSSVCRTILLANGSAHLCVLGVLGYLLPNLWESQRRVLMTSFVVAHQQHLSQQKRGRVNGSCWSNI